MTVATIENNTIVVKRTFPLDEFWLSLTGSCFANTQHWAFEIDLDDYDSPCEIVIRHEAKSSSDVETTILNPNQLVNAFSQLIQNNQTHCGGYPIDNLDNADSCFADLVLQQAIFGEVVFG